MPVIQLDPPLPGPRPWTIALLIGLYLSLGLLFLPVFPCPQPCCDRDRKLKRLTSLAGVTPAEARRMGDWAERYPCVRCGMSRRVDVVRWMR